jgi:hypothetical protein
MNDAEWKESLKTMTNEELSKQVENLKDWSDKYYSDLTSALSKEIRNRLLK